MGELVGFIPRLDVEDSFISTPIVHIASILHFASFRHRLLDEAASNSSSPAYGIGDVWSITRRPDALGMNEVVPQILPIWKVGVWR
jgi:hypothetical protein